MARLRLTLLLLALGIAIPAGLIVQRALTSLDLENEFRHEAVARRLFDEMERSLSTFLLREEARPIADYDATSGAAFAEVDEPFLVGWFTLDQAGQPRVVHARADEARVLAAVSSWAVEVASDELYEAEQAEEAAPRSPSPAPAADLVLTDHKAGRLAGKKDTAQQKGMEKEARSASLPAPGRTQRLGKSGVADDDSAEAFEQKQSGTAYEILSSLNRAPDLRSARKSKQQVLAQAAPEPSPYSNSLSDLSDSLSDSLSSSASPGSAEPASRAPGGDANAVRETSRAREKYGRRADELAEFVDAEEAPVLAPTRESNAGSDGFAASGRFAQSAGFAELDELARSSEPARSADATGRIAPGNFADSGPAEPPALADRDTTRRNEPAAAQSEGEGERQEREDRRTQRAADPDVRSAEPAIVRSEPTDLSYTIDPLIGRSTADGHVVLVRSVWRPDGAIRQGVVLDRAALASWLGGGVLSASGLSGRARLEFGGASIDPSGPGVPAAHRYVHRFAEPFDALVARLALEPLPGLGGPEPIYALSALLLGIAVIGLYAVQRGARTVVDYAQRRSDFVASVSHELKTPLTSIRMYGEMLRDGLVGNDTKREEYYATIADESERLTRLIDNVLEFSRLEQDRRELDLVVGSLAVAVREVGEKLRAHVEREGFALRLELDEALPAVRYDRDALTQVVFNLVDNALKYAASTDRRDIVIALRSQAGGSGVELCVRDFGPGVSPRSLRHIFEPFYRGGDELTRTAKGTGIGLALVRDLSAAMGASVSGANRPDGGFEVAVAFQAQA